MKTALLILALLLLSACANETTPLRSTVQSNPFFIRPPLEILEPEMAEVVYEEVSVQEAPFKTQQGHYVYLTFDDGPTRNTSTLLDILYRYGILGTFFFQGDMIQSHPYQAQILERTLLEGHYIGLHSMSHNPYLLYWGTNAYRTFYEEMRKNQELLYELTGVHTNLVRPPFGTAGTFNDNHIATIAESDFKIWDWNVDSRDWWHNSVDSIMSEITTTMTKLGYPQKVVVLFHEHDVTVAALPFVIAYFKELGFSFVPYHPDNHFLMNFLNHPDF